MELDELEEEEPVAEPGTTIGPPFSVLRYIRSAIVDEMWFLTTGPLTGISVIFAEFSK